MGFYFAHIRSHHARSVTDKLPSFAYTSFSFNLASLFSPLLLVVGPLFVSFTPFLRLVPALNLFPSASLGHVSPLAGRLLLTHHLLRGAAFIILKLRLGSAEGQPCDFFLSFFYFSMGLCGSGLFPWISRLNTLFFPRPPFFEIPPPLVFWSSECSSDPQPFFFSSLPSSPSFVLRGDSP